MNPPFFFFFFSFFQPLRSQPRKNAAHRVAQCDNSRDTAEHLRLRASVAREDDWQGWGPYLSERYDPYGLV